MAGWHHWLDGRESEWTPGVGDGQGGLACCDSWGHKESDKTEWLNWTELFINIGLAKNTHIGFLECLIEKTCMNFLVNIILSGFVSIFFISCISAKWAWNKCDSQKYPLPRLVSDLSVPFRIICFLLAFQVKRRCHFDFKEEEPNHFQRTKREKGQERIPAHFYFNSQSIYLLSSIHFVLKPYHGTSFTLMKWGGMVCLHVCVCVC